eukprot:4935818-Amphidinium_carterae.1
MVFGYRSAFGSSLFTIQHVCFFPSVSAQNRFLRLACLLAHLGQLDILTATFKFFKCITNDMRQVRCSSHWKVLGTKGSVDGADSSASSALPKTCASCGATFLPDAAFCPQLRTTMAQRCNESRAVL